MKIYIVGPSGAGKSHLARSISAKYHIPHIEVDKMWLRHGGLDHYKTLPLQFVAEKDALAAKITEDVQAALDQPDWVVDGNYSFIRERVAAEADTIIFLDMSALRTTLSLTLRELTGENKQRGYTRSDFMLHFQKSLWGNDYAKRKLRKSLAAHRGKIVTLRSRGEVNDYVVRLET